MKRICFYHAGCPDGFGAAWAARRAWGDDGIYRPCGHDDLLDARDFEGDLVVFADIAPSNETLLDLAEWTGRLVVLDHHVSARDRCEADPAIARAVQQRGHQILFDLAHSGAMLAWKYFSPGEPVPDLLRYVEDQDLWRWALPDSVAVNAAIGAYPRTFECWDELAARDAEDLAREGRPIERSHRADVERALKLAHPVALGSRRLEAVNSNHLRSAIGHELATRARFDEPIGLVYRLLGDRVFVSIYSVGDCNVAKIASDYGGGGHRNAAGFSIPLSQWTEKLA